MPYTCIVPLLLLALCMAQEDEFTFDAGEKLPPSPVEDFTLAEIRTLLDEGATSAALDELHAWLKVHPEDGEAWCLLGKGYVQAADELLDEGANPSMALEDAKGAFDRAMEIDRGREEAVFGAMDVYYRLSDFEAVETLAGEAAGRIVLEGREVPAWLRIGAAQARAELFYLAITEPPALFESAFSRTLDQVRAACDAVPENPILVLLHKDILQRVGLYGPAADVLQRALVEMPGAVEIHRYFIDLHFYQNTVYRLPEAYDSILADRPDAPAVMDDPEARDGPAAPDGPTARDAPAVLWYRGYGELLCGDLARKEARFQDAAQCYEGCTGWMERAADLEPAYTSGTRHYAFMARQGRGWCALREGDLKAAAVLFLENLDTAPDLRAEPDGLGRSLLDAVARFEAESVASGRFAVCLPIARRICEMERSEPTWFNNLGFMLRDYATMVVGGTAPVEGDWREVSKALYEESWQAYLRAAELDPEDTRIVNDGALIQAYHLRTDLERAVAMFRQAVEAGEARLAAMDGNTPESERYDTALAVGDAYQNLAFLAYHVDEDMEKARALCVKSMETDSGVRPAVQIYLDAIDGQGESIPDPFEADRPVGGAVAGPEDRVRLRGQVVWEPSFEAARERAKQENRPLFVYYRPMGLADAVAYLDQIVTYPGFARIVKDAVCVIADAQNYTFTERRADGRPVYSFKYDGITCREHIKSEEEFLAFWQEQRTEEEPLRPEENFYYFTPDGERFVPEETMRNLGDVFDALKEKTGEPKAGVDLDLLEAQVRGSWAPQRRRGAELLVQAAGRPARNRLEALLFNEGLQRAGRKALVVAVAGEEGEYFKTLLEALVKQYVDPELALLAAEAWPAVRGTGPLLFAMNWSESAEVRTAAAAAVARSSPDEQVQKILVAYELVKN